jgi:DNA-binding NtrC family response regulator
MDHADKCILVVDDEDPVRLSLSAYLEDEGFCVRMADCAEQALELSGTYPTDLAVVDLRLPGMDGASLITEMAKYHTGTKFIIHTGSTKFSLPDELKAVGLSEANVFFKPVLDMSDMVGKIKELLGIYSA